MMDHRGSDQGGSLFGGAMVLVATGVVLAVAYNLAGLVSEPSFGLPWIAQPKQLQELALNEDGVAADGVPSEAAVEGFSTDISDPMGVFGFEDSEAAELIESLPSPEVAEYPLQVQMSAVKRFYDAGAALIVDARDAEDYEAGHIPGAINLPYDEFAGHYEFLETLDTGGRPIITYCSGGTCETSMNLAFDLRSVGHSKVLVFLGGYPEWEDGGLPVDQGPGPEPEVR